MADLYATDPIVQAGRDVLDAITRTGPAGRDVAKNPLPAKPS